MSEGVSDEANAAAEEAEWALATAENLRDKGDPDAARTWFLRAAEYLMDAGLDDRALEVAKMAAALAPPSVAPPALSVVTVTEVVAVVAPAPVAPAPAPEPVAVVVASVVVEESIIVRDSVELDPVKVEVPPPAPVPKDLGPPVEETKPAPVKAPEVPARPVVPRAAERPAPVVAKPIPPPAPSPPPPAPKPVVAPAVEPEGRPSLESVELESIPPDAPSEPVLAAATVTVSVRPAAPSRASVRPPSQPPRAALVWQPSRAQASEILSARLLVLPLFQEVGPDARKRYAKEASILTFAPGEVMVAAPGPGERAVESALLVLTEGTAVTAVPGDDVPIALLGPGDVAGELGALHGGIPVAETVARTEVKAVSFAPSLVRAMAKEQYSIRHALDEAAWERAFAALGRGGRLLQRIPASERAKVFSRFEPVQVEEGALLLSEGSAPGALWMIAAGEVEVYGGALEGIWRARAGEALGLVALLDGAAAGVTARAVRRALGAKLVAGKFQELLSEYPQLAEARDDLGVVC